MPRKGRGRGRGKRRANKADAAAAPSAEQTSSSGGKGVALVMMDDRPPDLGQWLKQYGGTDELTLKSQAQLVTMLTAYLNMRYACRHGYTMLFYLLKQPGCAHPLWGARHPSYCKLTAIGDALARGYDWVVYLDSDAFVRGEDSLASMLHKYGAPADAGAPGSGEAFFGWDHPFTLGPNMGFIALRNTPAVRSMVRVWWNGFAGLFSLDHPFEQHTLQYQVMHLDAFSKRVQTLSLRTMDDTYPDDVVHLDHNAGTKTRIWVMAGAAANLLVGMGGEHARGVRRHLRLLERQREGLSKKKRRPVIEAVVRAARRDLESSEFAKTCAKRIETFNATDSALRHLWQGTLGTADDIADDTADDTAAATTTTAAATAARTTTPGAAARSSDAATATSRLLAGMPLQLANCSRSPLHAPWQTWRLTTEERTAKGSVCKGLCLAHRFSLQAAPGLCLSLGTTRTPRNPFQLHAQLAPCLSVRGESAAAMRARLHFNAKSRTIKTTHRVSDFRSGLPEHRTTCGFWPACSGLKLLLPKPCWAQLARNVSACGAEEESVANILERDRHLPLAERSVDAKTGFVTTASGPVPAALLNTSGRDRLCLTAWRGKNLEAAAAVFLRCPQGSGRHSKWRSSQNFEWKALRVDGGGEGTGGGELVRVSPRATPSLCLAAPPLASPALVGALGGVAKLLAGGAV